LEQQSGLVDVLTATAFQSAKRLATVFIPPEKLDRNNYFQTSNVAVPRIQEDLGNFATLVFDYYFVDSVINIGIRFFPKMGSVTKYATFAAHFATKTTCSSSAECANRSA
jgi:hypothetical protein